MDTTTAGAPEHELASSADVLTDRPDRYARQLASHLGRKAEVTQAPEGPTVHLGGGRCLLQPADRVLRLRAAAGTAEALERVEHVVGGHLERFGAPDGLLVAWSR